MGSLLSTNHWSAEGKHVLITGASSGIGAELGRHFAKQGASLALLARNRDSLMIVAEECKTLGAPRVDVFSCDLTDDANIKKAITLAIENFGKFDVLILNAGRSMGCYFEEINDLESINYMLKININGVINSLFYALPSVPKVSDSRIVVMSSVAGIIPVPFRTIYCASKHALAGFSNSLRIELKDTHGKDAPTIQLINFPEVKGTKLNSGRMDFGAHLPPMEFLTGSRVPSVQKACSELMKQIALGTEDWGQSLSVRILLQFRGVMANIVDYLILKAVKETHIRPKVNLQ